MITRWAVATLLGLGWVARAAEGDLVVSWNRMALDAIRYSATPPPVATRALAVVHAAMFDAANELGGPYVSYLAHTNPPAGALPEAALAAAANQSLRYLWPQFTTAFDESLQAQLRRFPAGAARNAGVAWGRQVANDVMAARAFDGSNLGVTYQPVPGPGRWEPTPPLYASALLPQWPSVRPFGLDRGDQFRPPAPPALASEQWASECNQVKDLGSAHSAVRTPEQTEIAWFWADNAGTETPPGHWNEVGQQLLAQGPRDLVGSARLFALLNLALADAAIVAWDAKYAYEFWRPVTAMHRGDMDGNPATGVDPAWTPLISTPPFPEYVSGHSTVSGAGASVLAAWHGGDECSFGLFSDGLFGAVRFYSRFSDAAEEAGMSRIYGGIHFLAANREGLAAGQRVGGYVAANFLLPRDQARIELRRAGPEIELSWPASFELETSSSLTAPVWTRSSARPPARVAAGGPARFYRLRQAPR